MTRNPADRGALYRLLAWLSPAFPVGGYSYSHGLESAVAEELVTNAERLREWCAAALEFGAGRIDAACLAAAHDAASARDWPRLAAVARESAARRPTAEAALEATAQGAAFLGAVRAAWPHPWLGKLDETEATHSVAVGLAAAAHGIDPGAALCARLHGFAATLVSAGVRLIPLGQTDGQRVLAALEPVALRVAAAAPQTAAAAPGTSTPLADWCSAIHETQYTRLFRS